MTFTLNAISKAIEWDYGFMPLFVMSSIDLINEWDWVWMQMQIAAVLSQPGA